MFLALTPEACIGTIDGEEFAGDRPKVQVNVDVDYI